MPCNPCPSKTKICSCILHPDYQAFRKRPATKVQMIRIIEEIAREHDVDPLLVIGKSRKKEVVLARCIAIKKIKVFTDATLQMIGRCFNRNHSTILYELNKKLERYD